MSKSHTKIIDIVHFPISEGRYRGRLLEILRTPRGVRARYEGNTVWLPIRTKYVNPHCTTAWLSINGKPGDINVHPLVWIDLMEKVRGPRKKHGNCKQKTIGI